jgi:hypothetical protein
MGRGSIGSLCSFGGHQSWAVFGHAQLAVVRGRARRTASEGGGGTTVAHCLEHVRWWHREPVVVEMGWVVNVEVAREKPYGANWRSTGSTEVALCPGANRADWGARRGLTGQFTQFTHLLTAQSRQRAL